MNNWLEYGIRLFEILSISYGTVWFSKKLDKDKLNKLLTMENEFKNKKKVQPMLESIIYELDADRVYQTAFSNGDVTFAGHHLKKVSVINELSGEGFKDLGLDIQLVPAKVFERNLNDLYESANDFIISKEFEINDDLSALLKQYDIQTLLKVKIKNFSGKWVGTLDVCFNSDKNFTREEIAFVKMQAAKLGEIKQN